MGYLKHYEDNRLRVAEFNSLSLNLLTITGNIAVLQTTVNNIGSSMAGNCATSSQANALQSSLNSQAIVIGGISNSVSNLPTQTYNAQITQLQNTVNATLNAVNALPNYSTSIGNIQTSVTSLSNQVAQVIGGQANQATSNQVSSLQATTNNIPRYNAQSDISVLSSQVGAIPTTNYSSNFSVVGNQLTALQSTANATQSRVNAIPNGTYNAQLDRIESNVISARAEGQNIPRAIYNQPIANLATQIGGIPTNTYNTQFNAVYANQASQANSIALAAVSTKIDNLQLAVNSINAGVSGGSTILVSNTLGTATLNLSNADRDLIYLIGASSTGYTNPTGIAITVTASANPNGDQTTYPFDRSYTDFIFGGSVNAWLQVDFGSSRSVTPNAIGWKARSDLSYNPVTLLIQGSNNGTSWTTLNTWITGGFTANQWKYQSFSNSTGYRYMRFQLSGTDNLGSYYLGGQEARIYGSSTNP